MTSHVVITPFKLAAVEKTKAVSETTFELDTQIQAFSRVQISTFKFMNLYEEEVYEQTQWPFTQICYGLHFIILHHKTLDSTLYFCPEVSIWSGAIGVSEIAAVDLDVA